MHFRREPRAAPLTAERLREMLTYEPDTGVFRRKGNRTRADLVGKEAGSINGEGYRTVGIDGRVYQSHRLAWLYVHGEWPASAIDHIDCDRLNNRISNLRPATAAENARNASKRRDNQSGLKGAYQNGPYWAAQIRIDGKAVHLGIFGSAEEAHAAYCRAADVHYGDFANTGERGAGEAA